MAERPPFNYEYYVTTSQTLRCKEVESGSMQAHARKILTGSRWAGFPVAFDKGKVGEIDKVAWSCMVLVMVFEVNYLLDMKVVDELFGYLLFSIDRF